MRLGRVIGSLHCTKKYPELEGYKLLIVQPVTSDNRPTGSPIICVDTVDAGIDDVVFFVEARDAAVPLKVPLTPSDATITGIVERVDSIGEGLYKR